MTETKAKHTPGPWRTGGGDDAGVFTSKCQIIADCLCEAFRESPMSIDEIKANAARIVSCVNACKGINPEAIPMMLNFILRYYLFCSFAGDYDYPESKISDSNKDARDSLLLALGKLPTIETKGETES